MKSFLPTLILRHRKENLKKCSLRGLEKRDNYQFYTYPLETQLPSLNNYLILTIDAPPLTYEDRNLGLFLIDGTWRYAAKMEDSLDLNNFIKRSIPKGFVTAYPRYQTECCDPDNGLASIEALYIAHLILGRLDKSLLDNYYWKDSFLKKNERLLHSLSQVC